MKPYNVNPIYPLFHKAEKCYNKNFLSHSFVIKTHCLTIMRAMAVQSLEQMATGWTTKGPELE
jgi:hypothetical protein